MPGKDRFKVYVENGYYHIYNRGVAKQKIFLKSQDYKVFLNYLKEALTTAKIEIIMFSLRGQSFKAIERRPKNFKEEVNLIAYCLMPNHFHLLIKQKNKNSMEKFMRSVITRYSSYFNKKYDRVGHVFQGRYKAILLEKDEYLLHLTRYIHINPLEINSDLTKAYSSYPDYLGLRKTKWVNPEIVIRFFNQKTLPEITKINTYKHFVESYKKDSKAVIGSLSID